MEKLLICLPTEDARQIAYFQFVVFGKIVAYETVRLSIDGQVNGLRSNLLFLVL